MYPSTETDTMPYMTDSVDFEVVNNEVPDEGSDDLSLDGMSEADQQFLSSLSDLFENQLLMRKKLAKQYLLSVLDQSEKCQCPSCKSLAQDVLEDFTRTWGD